MGSKPKAPKAAPDPAIAREKARRESIAIAQAGARKNTRFGYASTMTSKGGQDGISYVDPESTEAGKSLAEIEALEAKLSEMKSRPAAEPLSGDQRPNNGGRMAGVFLRNQIKEKRKGITPAASAEYEAAKSAMAIGSYLKGARARVGTTSTRG